MSIIRLRPVLAGRAVEPRPSRRRVALSIGGRRRRGPLVTSDPNQLMLAFLLPALLDLFILEHYPNHLNRRTSINQYFEGVYASRVLGRESVLALANSFNWIGRLLWDSKSSGLMIGWVLTNGISFMVAALLLYRLSVHRNVRYTGAYVVVVTLMAVSANVVTPYDALSFALIVAVFDRALARDTSRAVGLMVLATATRESSLLVVPFLAAALVDTDALRATNSVGRLRQLVLVVRSSRLIRLFVVTGVLVIGVLKVVPLLGAHRLRLVQQVGLGAHFSLAGAEGITTALLMVVTIRLAMRDVGDRRCALVRRRVAWVCASPYLVVCGVWGIWSEAPRLVMPLLLGEFLIVVSGDRSPSPSPDTIERGLTAGPVHA